MHEYYWYLLLDKIHQNHTFDVEIYNLSQIIKILNIFLLCKQQTFIQYSIFLLYIVIDCVSVNQSINNCILQIINNTKQQQAVLLILLESQKLEKYSSYSKENNLNHFDTEVQRTAQAAQSSAKKAQTNNDEIVIEIELEDTLNRISQNETVPGTSQSKGLVTF
ncbi:Hypothetical_protein [Hexamita inflata]|uniref:Hypothetical_protein n=1 Tax=Hexamita inflata TaxID=28002 RepID=A0AA86RBU4_9EUKA|nr:Hypothetical protein HINF_LOCUS57772 [Hexamita inflata]